MTVPTTRQRTTAANAKSSLWWEKSIVQRSTSSIENIVDTILMDSPFLQRHQQVETDVLQLDRSNIQIGSLLGKGSFSVVLEVKGLVAEQEEQGSPVEGRFAMKHLRPDLIQKPEMFQAAAADLLLEAKYLAALDHPGILKLRAVARGGVDAWENGQYDGYFLITDRLQGTLKDKIMEWQFLQQDESLLECLPLSGTSSEVREDHMMSNSLYSSCAIPGPALHEKLLLEKLDIARQLASALQYMHERRLIFRDLKPPNVGMTADNQVRVFDFGFCRELPPQWDTERDDESQYKQLDLPEGEEDDDDALYYMSGKGSLMYLAPEVLYNGRYNRKADCYSFAMVLYELLTLNKPFHSVSSLEVFRELLVKHKARPPLEYSDIPLPLQDLLRHSWEDTVSDRWTMKTISQRLQEISQELDPSMEQEEEQVPASTEPQQQLLSEPITICGGGAILDLLTGFASDVQLGYKILYGNKVLDFPDSQRQEPTPKDEDNYSDELEKQTSDLTGATEACSQCSEEPSLRINALTATEEPVEFTLEDAMSMPGWDSWSEGESEEEDDTDYDEQPLLPQLSITKTHSGAEGVIPDDEPLTPCFPNRVEAVPCDEDMRCPPSPALQRTASAPLGQPTICKDRAVPESPHHYPQRRMSLGVKKGFYIMPESPHYPSLSRRQSAGDINFAALPESHFLPTAAELRGILPTSA